MRGLVDTVKCFEPPLDEWDIDYLPFVLRVLVRFKSLA